MTDGTPELDRYWQTLSAAAPTLSAEDQRTAVGLYRELAKGVATTPAQLTAAWGISNAETQALLAAPSIEALTSSDENGHVVGFGGLATTPTRHRFQVDGRQLWTWCAWDSLFIPGLLDETARVISTDAETGENITLVVTPHEVRSVSPATAVVSFVQPDERAFDESAARLMSTFCQFVFFFASPESGRRWVEGQPGALLCSVDEAFELGRRLNEQTFGRALAGPLAGPPDS